MEYNEKRIIVIAKGSTEGNPNCLHDLWGVTLLERCLFVSKKLNGEHIEIITDEKEQIQRFLVSQLLLDKSLSTDIRKAAINALGKIGDIACVEALNTVYEEEKTNVLAKSAKKAINSIEALSTINRDQGTSSS